MRPDKSFKLYPRQDQEFKKKHSLDFQRVLGNLYGKRPTGNKTQAFMWIMCLIIGVIMGSIAFLMDLIVNFFGDLRWNSAETAARDHAGLGWFVLIVFSVLFIVIAAALTMFIAPTAMGSGVAEAMGIMNGVAYPDYISLQGLFVKFIGVSLAVAGGLCGGKEGPLVHIGAIVGYASAYLPLGITQYFRNDFEKRKLMAVGTAAGVSCAFGAPIGGSLFAYEISKPNTFWSFSLTWKVFFSSTVSTFILSVFKQLYDGLEPVRVSNSDIIKLGETNYKAPTMDSLIAAIILGSFGGLLGAIFIIINNSVNTLRKYHLKNKWLKILESNILVILTATVMYLAVYIRYAAATDPDNNSDICDIDNKQTVGFREPTSGIEPAKTRQFLCPDGKFDRLATLMFDSQANIIKTFMASGLRTIILENALIFMFIWYFFVCITSGTAVPVGIFIPCILIGCSVGHVYSHIHEAMGFKVNYSDPSESGIQPGIFAILGATAVLSGSTRMTYSLAVIMLETTSSVELFFPIIFTLFASYGTGALLINKSIYLSALRSKNIPLLSKDIPRENRNLLVKEAMSAPPICFLFVAKVKDIYFQLSTTNHNGFPVQDKQHRLIGLVERDVLITLIEKQAWYFPNDSKLPTFGDGIIIKKDRLSDINRNNSMESSSNGRVRASSQENQYIQSNFQQNLLQQDMELMHQQEQKVDEADYEDYRLFPIQDDKIQWQDLNQDFKSNIRNYKDITELAVRNPDQLLDLRPYMIERPYSVTIKDKLPKALNLFRQMQLRQLPVINDTTCKVEGIITRQDLFQYMSL
ncbi:h(+) cl(-) exchange transporter 7-like isoform 2 [Stylonychia lemnae]|uniref:Chloride channel protein n=1 Tax=Stylonychia lemnae TaxID=5949 RepID=A0A078AR06_STYLE|nr:h(+) cl(-) exchange transporter 7-like isoform 2 [Stylonychia lemnae]|eukprot:CDW84850.1 h(+) cl(-) exchange transporter 7-like isoform 2 [Stylonychia lemnae]